MQNAPMATSSGRASTTRAVTSVFERIPSRSTPSSAPISSSSARPGGRVPTSTPASPRILDASGCTFSSSRALTAPLSQEMRYATPGPRFRGRRARSHETDESTQLAAALRDHLALGVEPVPDSAHALSGDVCGQLVLDPVVQRPSAVRRLVQPTLRLIVPMLLASTPAPALTLPVTADHAARQSPSQTLLRGESMVNR